MGYVLLVLLIIELLIFYIFNEKNIVSPSFLGCTMFIMSTVIYLLSEEYFGYKIHGVTVAVIVFLLICVFAGERFANKIKVPTLENKSISRIEEQKSPIAVPTVVCLLIALVILAISILHFIKSYQYSLSVGNPAGNFATMAKYIREAKTKGFEPLNLPFYINQGIVISECFVWFCVYGLCNNKNATDKFYYRYCFPIIAYLPNIWVTDNRTTLLKMVAICAIIIFIFTKQKYGWTAKGNLKIIFVGVLTISIYLAVFRWLGYRTETSLRNELWDNLVEYTSSSLVGLDKYLLEGEPPNTLLGEGTLKGVYNILRQWGFPIPPVDQFEPFYTYANGRSNAYTTFKAYIHDYTLIGATIAMFLWGAIINYNMRYIQRNGAGFIRMCLVGMMFYPVAMLSIADTTASILAMGTLYILLYLILINELLIKRNIRLTIH